MNSKVMDRPAVATYTPRASVSAAKTDPREKIIWKLSELQAAIAQTVDVEQGSCVGRVLDYAGKQIALGARAFSVMDGTTGYGHPDLIEAESFIKAATALAVEECRSAPADGRTVLMRRLAADIDALTTEVDTYSMDFNKGGANLTAADAPTKGDTAQELAADAEGWVDIALETLQVRLQDLNSNVAYGVRSLMRTAKAAIASYAQSLPTGWDTYDTATEEMGIAIDSLDAFNDDSVDDLVLYAAGLALEKAQALLVESGKVAPQGAAQ